MARSGHGGHGTVKGTDKKRNKNKKLTTELLYDQCPTKGVGSRFIGRSTATKTRGKVGVLLPTSELGVPYVEMWFVNRSL